jgi:hypothetical protein
LADAADGDGVAGVVGEAEGVFLKFLRGGAGRNDGGELEVGEAD